MNDNAGVEIECVNKVYGTVIVKCWESASRTARILWYEATKTIEILILELFHRNVATRVDAKGQLSHSRRYHFKKDRTLPRPQLGTADEAHMPHWLTKGVEFCKSQAAGYIPRIFTDGTYDKAEHDLHSESASEQGLLLMASLKSSV